MTTPRTYGLFSNGETVAAATGATRQLVEPASGQPFGTGQLAGPDEANALDAYLETNGILVNTGNRPINPFGL